MLLVGDLTHYSHRGAADSELESDLENELTIGSGFLVRCFALSVWLWRGRRCSSECGVLSSVSPREFGVWDSQVGSTCCRLDLEMVLDVRLTVDFRGSNREENKNEETVD